MKARTYSIIEFKRILENNGYLHLDMRKGTIVFTLMVNALLLLRGLM